MPACPKCESFYTGGRCDMCGWAPPRLSEPSSAPPVRCPIDGGPLGEHGLCERGGGYPVTTSCPFVCPLCRGHLDWTGGCQQCHGTTTGRRADWTFPGEGYYTHDVDGKPITDGMHYVRQQPANRPVASQATNAANAKELARILGGWR